MKHMPGNLMGKERRLIQLILLQKFLRGSMMLQDTMYYIAKIVLKKQEL